MPFANKQQMKACFAQYHRDVKAGRVPAWDCYKWLEEEKGYKSSKKRSKKRSSKKRSKKRSSKKRSSKKRSVDKYDRLSKKKMSPRVVHIGPKGGKYKIYKGRRIYIQ